MYVALQHENQGLCLKYVSLQSSPSLCQGFQRGFFFPLMILWGNTSHIGLVSWAVCCISTTSFQGFDPQENQQKENQCECTLATRSPSPCILHKLRRGFRPGSLWCSKIYILLCWFESTCNGQILVYKYFMQRCRRGFRASLFPWLAIQPEP